MSLCHPLGLVVSILVARPILGSVDLGKRPMQAPEVGLGLPSGDSECLDAGT